MSPSRHISRTSRRRRERVPRGTRKALPRVYLRGGNKIIHEIYMIDHGTHKGAMVKWILSTMFAGLVGVGAIGTVLYASMKTDRELGSGDLFSQLRGIATRAMKPFKPLLVNHQTGPHFIGPKSDRLIVTAKGLSTRQIIHDSFARKRDNREYLVIKPYARLINTLATARPDNRAAIPPFDPYKLYTNRKPAEKTDGHKSGGASPGATTATSPLSPEIAPGDDSYTLSDARAQILVAIAADDFFASDRQLAANDDTASDKPSGENPALSPSAGLKNTTIIEKTSVAANADQPEPEQHQITVRSGDSMAILLRSAGAEGPQIAKIIAAMNKIYPAANLKIGQKLRYVAVPKPSDPGKTEPAEISLYSGKQHLVTISRNEAGEYVASKTAGTTRFYGRKNSWPRRATLYESFYQAGLQQKLSANKILKLLRIHAFDTDFKRRTQPGDSFEAFFDTRQDRENFENIPNELLYTSITVNGRKRAFYRFRTPDGRIDYYDRDGKNAKKFLMRKPVRGNVRLSSGFGYRMHPILHVRKLHAGTDWAGPRGSRILAAGDGIVEKAAMTAYSGNYVRIRHANGYKTSYSHLQRIAAGIKKGVRVRQGQIIGLLGNTGRSTGPHLHFEVLINNRPVNAMTIPVPRGRVLKGYLLTKFKKERDRIDELMSRDPVTTRVASVK